MKILILGGTIFLGRHLVEILLKQGHAITLFNRGKHNPDLFPELEKIHGDRDKDLERLNGMKFDAVIDTCGYFPRMTKISADYFKDKVEHYTFISSISVYPDFTLPGIDENSEIGRLEDETVEVIDGNTYGPLKALCEKSLENEMPGRVLNIRPGLIVGPFDPSDRFTYWPFRFGRGGEILVPDAKENLIQFIDVRDLAGWIVNAIEKDITGVFNLTGPASPIPFLDFINECRETINRKAMIIKVPEDFLLENNIAPWSEIPLWIPKSKEEVSIEKALKTGLKFTPLKKTIQDTFNWNDKERPEGFQYISGLKPEKEKEIIEFWENRSK
ncbi:MAG: NAD-dependent epimerase/dehydratase family protein [bacterium]|nr:NAD-dependent epimerase/dehydratase family protein [bacterium]